MLALKRLFTRWLNMVRINNSPRLICVTLAPFLLAATLISFQSSCDPMDSRANTDDSGAESTAYNSPPDGKCWHLGQGIDWLNAEDANGYELVATIVEGAYPKVQFLTKSTRPGDCTVISFMNDAEIR